MISALACRSKPKCESVESSKNLDMTMSNVQETSLQSPSTPRITGSVNPWFIAVTVTIAAFMELLDTSIANVALPYIGGGLGRSYDEVTWILTTYLVANAVVLPMTRMAQQADGPQELLPALRRPVHGVVAVLRAGAIPRLHAALRIVQGIGGGGLAPVAQAILVDTFPPAKRAAAFALYTIVIVTAPAVGPVLGGWITDNYNWRWIFFINVPIGLIVHLSLEQAASATPRTSPGSGSEAKAEGRMSIDGLGHRADRAGIRGP